MRIALVLVTALLLAGCSAEPEPDPMLDSAEAIAEYQDLYDDIEEAMAGADIGEPRLESQHSLVPQGGEDPLCGLWIGRASSAEGVEIPWDREQEFVDLINPILAEHGWPALVKQVHEHGPGFPDYDSELEDGTATVGLTLRGPNVTASVFSYVTDDPCGD